jgi:hypothetical protein
MGWVFQEYEEAVDELRVFGSQCGHSGQEIAVSDRALYNILWSEAYLQFVF